ncbi:hypothetical protein EBR96_08185 [bacterium]|nr:hypothetical protein [bacterium]
MPNSNPNDPFQISPEQIKGLLKDPKAAAEWIDTLSDAVLSGINTQLRTARSHLFKEIEVDPAPPLPIDQLISPALNTTEVVTPAPASVATQPASAPTDREPAKGAVPPVPRKPVEPVVSAPRGIVLEGKPQENHQVNVSVQKITEIPVKTPKPPVIEPVPVKNPELTKAPVQPMSPTPEPASAQPAKSPDVVDVTAAEKRRLDREKKLQEMIKKDKGEVL